MTREEKEKRGENVESEKWNGAGVREGTLSR